MSNVTEVINNAKAAGWNRQVFTKINMTVDGMDIQATVTPQSVSADFTVKVENSNGGFDYAKGSIEYFFANGKTRFGTNVKGKSAVRICNINSYSQETAFIVTKRTFSGNGKITDMFYNKYAKMAIEMAKKFIASDFTVA